MLHWHLRPACAQLMEVCSIRSVTGTDDNKQSKQMEWLLLQMFYVVTCIPPFSPFTLILQRKSSPSDLAIAIRLFHSRKITTISILVSLIQLVHWGRGQVKYTACALYVKIISLISLYPVYSCWSWLYIFFKVAVNFCSVEASVKPGFKSSCVCIQ